MQVKAYIEKTVYEIATVEVDDDDLLDYFNNGGEHNYSSLDEIPRSDTFTYILREYVEDKLDDNPLLVGIPRSPDRDPRLEVNKVEEVED